MSETDVRWKQRLPNYGRALEQLDAGVALARSRELSDLERQGLIQAFEFTHELAWDVMTDWFAYQGNPGITGSRDAIREAFDKALIDDGEGWMEMIASRNQTAHAYDQAVAERIANAIVTRYADLFRRFHDTMKRREEAQ